MRKTRPLLLSFPNILLGFWAGDAVENSGFAGWLNKLDVLDGANSKFLIVNVALSEAVICKNLLVRPLEIGLAGNNFFPLRQGKQTRCRHNKGKRITNFFH